jgi:transposase InsO family protein
VREDADGRFARVLFPDVMASNLRGCNERQRNRALKIAEWLNDWQCECRRLLNKGFTRDQAATHFLVLRGEAGESVGKRTLYRWERQYRDGGVDGLIDGRAKRRGKSRTGDAGADSFFFGELKWFWLRPQRPTAKSAYDYAVMKCEERGLTAPCPAYRTARRFLANLSLGVKTKMREGQAAFEAKVEPYIERDYEKLHSNQLWVSDHHQFDVLIDDGEGGTTRPWLTAFMDMRSRKIMGAVVYIGSPNQNTILTALRRAILQHGTPKGAYFDNGKDFDAFGLHGRTKRERRRRTVAPEEWPIGPLAAMNIKVHFATPYHPQSKPIERFFGTLADQFSRGWGTYCGSSPQTKPAGLVGRLKRGDSPTLADFEAAFDQYLDVYHAAPHRGQGMNGHSPDEIYAASWGGAAKMTAPQEVLDLLLKKATKPQKIGRNGVQYGGLWYGAHEPALNQLSGKSKSVVIYIDPDDLSHVQVRHVDGRFICEAACNRRLPAEANDSELKAAIAQKKRDSRALTEGHAARMRIAEDTVERMHHARMAANRRAAAERPPLPPDGPSSIKLLPAAQSPDMQRARKLIGSAVPTPKAKPQEDIFALIQKAMNEKEPNPKRAPKPDLLMAWSERVHAESRRRLRRGRKTA